MRLLWDLEEEADSKPTREVGCWAEVQSRKERTWRAVSEPLQISRRSIVVCLFVFMCLYSYLTSILAISSIFFLPLPSNIHPLFTFHLSTLHSTQETSILPLLSLLSIPFFFSIGFSKCTLFDFRPFISIPFYLPTHIHNVLFIASKYSNHNIPPFWTPTGQIFHSSGFPHGSAILFYI